MLRLVVRCCFFLGLIVGLGGGEAVAQSTSTCMAVGPNIVDCTTTGGSNSTVVEAPYTQWAYERDKRIRENIHELFTGDRKKVGAMIANGNCQGALKYALERGQFDLAQSIKPLCQAKEPPQNIAMVSPSNSQPEPGSPPNQIPASCTPDQVRYAQSVGVDCHSLGRKWSAN
jgi:hypothetical protein